MFDEKVATIIRCPSAFENRVSNEPPTILSEAHGRKIIKWANSGEGYTPVVRKNEEVTVDDLKTIKAEIVNTAKAAGGQGNEEVMNIIREYVPSGNPNGVRDIESAKELLAKLKALGNN